MPSALAVFAHPDDIEFVAAGTLLLLGERGWDLHYHTVANGECGSMEAGPEETARLRGRESEAAASILGARYHPPISRDLCVFYDEAHLRKLGAVVRKARPEVILTHALDDYMEDHTTTARLAVTAAFSRGMPNFLTEPEVEPWSGETAVYHALPHGFRGPLGEAPVADFFVDVGTVQERKKKALAAHASQKAWLDATQGMDSLLKACDEAALAAGALSDVFALAEGWRCHSHLGFSPNEIDPLGEALGANLVQTGSAGTR